MTVKPADLIYSVEENPPLGATLLLAIQHLIIAVVYLVYPVIVVTEAGGSLSQATFAVQFSMLAIGIGTIIQVRTSGMAGSGFLIPHVTTAAYLMPSIMAARSGGLALVLGMTTIAGLFVVLISPFMKKLRVLFPPEVSGVVVAMIGFSLAKAAISRFVGMGTAESVVDPLDLLVGCVTLATMISLVVWSNGNLRLYSAAIGLAAGYGLSLMIGNFNTGALTDMAGAPLVSLPSWEHPGFKFDLYLIPPFLIGALASVFKASGVVINCQKINDPEWKRADMNSVGKGLLADGIGCISAGLLGGAGTSMSAANVGLSMATGATSRRVGYYIGLFFILLVFLPKFSVVLTLMPLPVMGAGLMYVASFLIASGIQLIMTRMMDSRRTFIVGLSFLAGISVETLPGLYQNLSSWASPIFNSSLTMATLTAFTLNLIFRIGVSQKASIELAPEMDVGSEIYRFLENQGAKWGARPQVIHEAKHILRELVEALFMYKKTKGPVHVEALFDEFNLNIHATYNGQPMEFPQSPPTEDELMLNPGSLARMSGFMIQFMAEKVTATVNSNICKVSIHITH
jgi:NCS2 family nucleobase:cation symporter-2